MKEQQQIVEFQVQGQPRKLNWTKVLFDYHICLDAQAFEKWNGDLTMSSQEILQKDIPRTRSLDPYMKKQSFQQVLRRITTFYCKQNGVTYQQGLLQVVFPFALLRNKNFQTKKCYAYFNAFMRKHFPKAKIYQLQVLVQRIFQGKKQLPHAILSLTLTQILLGFHYPVLAKCFKDNQMPMSLVATQQLLTIFAKNLPIKFVYQIYDYFIKKNDQNYIFYMQVALLGLQQHNLLQAAADDQLHKEIQNMKQFNSIQRIKEWFKLAQKIQKQTPQSFPIIASQYCFSNRNLLSVEDVQKMLKSQRFIAGGYLPVSIEQINKNTSQYILVVLQNSKISSEHKYQTIKLNLLKPPESATLLTTKIYVLVAHEKNLQQQTTCLIKWAGTVSHLKFLMLKQHLIDQKNKKCSIF